jgi:hypothetical protein
MIILNEREYVEEHYLRNNEIDEKPYDTLLLLARYYRNCLGYKKKQTQKLLSEYMSKNYPRYSVSRRKWDETIEDVAGSANNSPLHEIDCVWITKAELDVLDKVENKKMQLVAFTLLCLAKYHNLIKSTNNGWVNEDAKEIFDLARVNISMEDKDYMLHDIRDLGLIEFPMKTGNLANKVVFIDDNSEKVLRITDFRELGREYLLYKGGNFVRCSGCGRLIPKKTNTRYCPECSEKKPDPEQKAENMRKVTCVDCGKVFFVPAKNTKTCRCDECRLKREKELKTERNRRYYEKIKTVSN